MTQERTDSIEEIDIRYWFARVELEQALDTFRVVEGILLARKEAQPKRKTRADKGTKRNDEQDILIDKRKP